MKEGSCKLAAGPQGLVTLVKRLAVEHEVTVDGDGLRWTRGSKSPGGHIRPDQLEAVQQKGKSVVVTLNNSSYGVHALTMLTGSSGEARAWQAEIQDLIDGREVISEALGARVTADNFSRASEPPPIKMTYTVEGGVAVEAEFDLLVIACDPRNLEEVCDYTPSEVALFDKLVNFTFHTTLLKVRTAGPQNHGVIFAPGPLDTIDGSVYGFRNESAKQFGLDASNAMSENLVTVYQLRGHKGETWAQEQFEATLRAQLGELSWWPYGDEYEVVDQVTTPYFNHFHEDSLTDGSPWKLLEQQGQRQTLLVHATTCFESALHCWSYATLMLETVTAAKNALPQDLAAPIAILGAGVSGLLFATRLSRLGYSNVRILESTERYGGKTHTVIEDGPFPEGKTDKTVCELGTCYMSPAYDPLIEDLKRFLVDNDQIDFTKDNTSFRGIVTTGQLPDDFEAPTVMPYADYVVLKAEAMEGHSNNWFDRLAAKADLAADLARYGLIHAEYVGWNMPMPSTPPAALKEAFGTQTFVEFLEDHDMLGLVGMLQYGYEVQGYGPLHLIPAYYGLLWVTPAVTWAILSEALKLRDKPVLTAWTKGWGDLWDQVVQKQGLNITFSAKVTSIVRSA